MIKECQVILNNESKHLLDGALWITSNSQLYSQNNVGVVMVLSFYVESAQ